MTPSQVTYDIDFVADSTQVQAKKCNGIIFRNIGDTDAFISGIPLYAGEVNKDFFENHPGEVLINSFDVKFKPGTLGTNPLIAVLRKYSDGVPASQACKFKR